MTSRWKGFKGVLKGCHSKSGKIVNTFFTDNSVIIVKIMDSPMSRYGWGRQIIYTFCLLLMDDKMTPDRSDNTLSELTHTAVSLEYK